MLSWSANCVITDSSDEGAFATTDTKLYVPVVTLSTQDSTKLLKQLKSGFKGTVIRRKYQSKVSTHTQIQYLDYLIDPNFQGNNRMLVLSFEDNVVRTRYLGYFLSKIKKMITTS